MVFLGKLQKVLVTLREELGYCEGLSVDYMCIGYACLCLGATGGLKLHFRLILMEEIWNGLK